MIADPSHCTVSDSSPVHIKATLDKGFSGLNIGNFVLGCVKNLYCDFLVPVGNFWELMEEINKSGYDIRWDPNIDSYRNVNAKPSSKVELF